MKKVVIGIDVSKEKLDVFMIVAENVLSVKLRKYLGTNPNTKNGCGKIAKGVAKLAGGVPSDEWMFCVVTTGGYSQCVCDAIYAKGLTIWKESALQIKLSKGILREKDDRSDAEMIAEYALRNQDKCRPYMPDSMSVTQLKLLFRYREWLVNSLRAAKTRLVELKDTAVPTEVRKFIEKDTQKMVSQLEKSIAECESRMAKVIENDSLMKKNFGHITSVKGIGMVNAVELIICTNNFQSISEHRKLSCYCGTAPFYRQSGTSVHGRAQVGNLSNRSLKAHLTNAAQSAIRYDPEMRAYYQGFIDRGKHKGVALNNVKNRLLRVVCSLIRTGSDYETEHEQKRAENTKN